MKSYRAKGYCLAGVTIVSLMGLATAVIWTLPTQSAQAHCQVPCGIYDDAARIAGLNENARTIAKAIKQINELAVTHESQAANQAARWIMTKEQHASSIIETVSVYFLTQKVKPIAKGAEGYDAYLTKLADHHAVMTAAMKTKQTVDSEAVEKLKLAIDVLAIHYKEK